jgi:hypothetical protein
MLWIKVRKIFKKWKLYERESLFGTTTICYEQQNIVKIERTFNLSDKDKIHDFLFNLYFEYDHEEWRELSARQIALLLWCHHSTVDHILDRAKKKILQEYQPKIKNCV